jgi:CRP-like cAMP-binding protein
MAMEPLFIHKLRHGAALTPEDAAALAALPFSVRNAEPRSDFGAESDAMRSIPIILEGWACRYRLLENGKRQVVTLLLPGDLCEPFGVLPNFLDRSLAAITAVRYASAQIATIRTLAKENIRIETALWWDLMMATEIEREHLVSLGRRSASERMGHLFCELHFRLAMVGLADSTGFELPVSQADLGDLLGLSAVHVNRSLQELRRSQLISLSGRWLRIHDMAALRDVSYFDSAYLRAAALVE